MRRADHHLLLDVLPASRSAGPFLKIKKARRKCIFKNNKRTKVYLRLSGDCCGGGGGVGVGSRTSSGIGGGDGERNGAGASAFGGGDDVDASASMLAGTACACNQFLRTETKIVGSRTSGVGGGDGERDDLGESAFGGGEGERDGVGE